MAKPYIDKNLIGMVYSDLGEDEVDQIYNQYFNGKINLQLNVTKEYLVEMGHNTDLVDKFQEDLAEILERLDLESPETDLDKFRNEYSQIISDLGQVAFQDLIDYTLEEYDRAYFEGMKSKASDVAKAEINKYLESVEGNLLREQNEIMFDLLMGNEDSSTERSVSIDPKDKTSDETPEVQPVKTPSQDDTNSAEMSTQLETPTQKPGESTQPETAPQSEAVVQLATSTQPESTVQQVTGGGGQQSETGVGIETDVDAGTEVSSTESVVGGIATSGVVDESIANEVTDEASAVDEGATNGTTTNETTVNETIPDEVSATGNSAGIVDGTMNPPQDGANVSDEVMTAPPQQPSAEQMAEQPQPVVQPNEQPSIQTDTQVDGQTEVQTETQANAQTEAPTDTQPNPQPVPPPAQIKPIDQYP